MYDLPGDAGSIILHVSTLSGRHQCCKKRDSLLCFLWAWRKLCVSDSIVPALLFYFNSFGSSCNDSFSSELSLHTAGPGSLYGLGESSRYHPMLSLQRSTSSSQFPKLTNSTYFSVFPVLGVIEAFCKLLLPRCLLLPFHLLS